MTRRTTNLMVGLLTLDIGTLCIRPQSALAVFKWWDVNDSVSGAGDPTPNYVNMLFSFIDNIRPAFPR